MNLDTMSMKSDNVMNPFSMDKEVKLAGNSTNEVSSMHKYGFTEDPYDKKPFENQAKCYYCQAAFSVKSYLQNFESNVSMQQKKSCEKMVINQCAGCGNRDTISLGLV